MPTYFIMKRIILLILTCWAASAYSQSVGNFRFDTTKFYKQGGFNEVKILNSTLSVTGGVFTNVGNGWGKWVLPSSSGSPNSNIGAGYRLAVPNTNNIKTLFAGTNITMDSVTNVNGITINSTASSTAIYETQTASGSTTFSFTTVPASYSDYIIFVNGTKIRSTTDYTTAANIVTIPTIVVGDQVEYNRIK